MLQIYSDFRFLVREETIVFRRMVVQILTGTVCQILIFHDIYELVSQLYDIGSRDAK